MARYDKYDSKVSGTRAFLAANWLAADVNKVVGVGLDTAGRIVKGGGNSGIIGVLVLTRVVKAGIEPVDPMKRGEITGLKKQGPNEATAFAAAAGTKYYVDNTTGALTASATGATYIGHTVEADRLVVGVAA